MGSSFKKQRRSLCFLSSLKLGEVLKLLLKRRLGRTNLSVTAVSFGGLPLQRCTLEEAGPVLASVLDQGINFIDTARAYTDSEEKIGHYLKGRRHEYYLATKSMARDKQGMARDIDLSLAQLQTDHIDLYQIHNIKTRQDLDTVLAPAGALEALVEAREQGKIAHIGVTGHSVSLLIEALQTGHFSTVQVPFNFIEQDPLQELFPLAKKLDVGIIVMKPLGGGQITHTDLALRWLLSQEISVTIPGMDTVEQIQKNFTALSEYRPLIASEIDSLAQEATELGPNFCRRCGYCMPCTVNIDIPQTFIFHLQYTRYGLTDAIPKRYAALPFKASDCIECGVCETRCPYDLPIRAKLKQAAADLER